MIIFLLIRKVGLNGSIIKIDFSHVYQLLEIGCGNGKLWENNTYNLSFYRINLQAGTMS